ncbi:O-antigen ligase family protein [Roseovarius sp. C7]|uniref:O-antigen ligase family protein n=1 Tax=Roseovarius sp. C7 TaxID=3398643 RepID=UPI0039F5840F
MPNPVAYLMLILWPGVSLMLFLRLPVERAIIWTVLAGYLLLPQGTEFDLPLVPDMDKVSIPNVCAFGMVVLLLKERVRLWPETWTMRVLLLGFVLGVVPTVLTNREPIIFSLLGVSETQLFEVGSLPGLRVIDLFSVLSIQLITLMPFFLGRNFLSREEGMRDLLVALALGGLAYSLPALFEIRLSPQLHVWIYGFFQHDFEQMMRDGGFRPIVFLPHALWLAFFLMTSVVSLMALSRAEQGVTKARALVAGIYLLGVLVLCKSLASMLYAMILVPGVLFASERAMVRVAFLMAAVAVIYPMLRSNGWVPLDAILERAEAFNPDRAQSLEYRFNNETLLLDRAQEKPWFGWGGWGRNLVHDMATGRILTIPDGEWIIVFGSFGWVGYLSQMGLLAVPVYMMWRHLPREGGRRSIYACVVTLILAVTLVDMLINAILTPFTWLIAGAVWGRAEAYLRKDDLTETKADPGPRRIRTVLQPDGPKKRRTLL